jgi:repressor LexA
MPPAAERGARFNTPAGPHCLHDRWLVLRDLSGQRSLTWLASRFRRTLVMITEAEGPMTDREPPGTGVVLTWRRRRILQVIDEYAVAHGCSPSNREIATAVGLQSPSAVHHHLQALKTAGLVSYEAGSPRTVRVLRPGEPGTDPAPPPDPEPAEPAPAGRPRISWVPVAGQIAAGAPIPPLEPAEGRVPLPRAVVGPEEGLFILEVVGDSMIGVGIFHGDWVVVRELFDKPRDGDIVAAEIDGIEVEGTVKTYRKVDRRVWLMPQNPAYTPIPGDKATIRGKVVAVLRQVGQVTGSRRAASDQGR